MVSLIRPPPGDPRPAPAPPLVEVRETPDGRVVIEPVLPPRDPDCVVIPLRRAVVRTGHEPVVVHLPRPSRVTPILPPGWAPRG